MNHNTLILDSRDYSEKAVALYTTLGRVHRGKGPLAEIDILVTRLSRVDKNLIHRMPKLKIVATSTTGLNHIDLDELQARKIKLISLRGQTSFLKNITSTAEEGLALMLALARNLPWAFDDVKAGNWNREQWRGHQLAGQTLGILGFGRLGKILANYAGVLGMRVIAHDPFVDAKTMKQSGAAPVSMDELFKQADMLSLQVLLTEKTENLVTERHLKMMKPTAYLINTARAELIEKGALEKALKEKWIAGAAVDVLRDEDESGAHLTTSDLAAYANTHRNLIILPHLGGATFEAMAITEEFLAGLVKKTLKAK